MAALPSWSIPAAWASATSTNLTEQVEAQIQTAMDSAEIVLFVVDCRDGPTPLDQEVAKRLRYLTVPVLLVVNKADTPALDAQADEFYRFGRKMFRTSAKENRGKTELLDALFELLPEETDEQTPDDPVMKVAIVGRRKRRQEHLGQHVGEGRADDCQ